MSDVFPPWANRLTLPVAVGGLLGLASVTAGVWYYFTPKYTRVGYQPLQPIAFSHATHVEQLGLDCRYCHDGVEQSWYSNLPESARCLNCHNQVLQEDPRLALVHESARSGRPIPWVQVHKTPDFVYFNHAVHVRRGVSCVSCHGRIDLEVETRHAQPLSMSFCLDCHRQPAPNLRPLEAVYDLQWQATNAAQALAEGERLARQWDVKALDQCSVCHR